MAFRILLREQRRRQVELQLDLAFELALYLFEEAAVGL
jgi:hypothetical protein